jgi:hypothetical protein
MPLSGRPQILRQSPRIAMLFQPMHNIVGNSVAFFFRQLLTETAHKFSCAPRCEGDGEA